jgi:hypothetical protein
MEYCGRIDDEDASAIFVNPQVEPILVLRILRALVAVQAARQGLFFRE